MRRLSDRRALPRDVYRVLGERLKGVFYASTGLVVDALAPGMGGRSDCDGSDSVTFSLAGRCARTGMFGAVVPRRVLRGVPVACGRDPVWGGLHSECHRPHTRPEAVGRLADGLAAQAAMDHVVAHAAYPECRQLTVVDASGAVASHSGVRTLGTYIVATGVDAVAAGNLLNSEKVPQAMVEAFGADLERHLADRLLAGLRAGEEAEARRGRCIPAACWWSPMPSGH